jgi:hypothetical protein
VTNLLYNLRLVGKSLRRDRWFTIVMVLSQALSVSIFVTALVSAQRYSNVSGQLRSDVFRIEAITAHAAERFYRGTQFEGFGAVHRELRQPADGARAVRDRPARRVRRSASCRS